MISYFSLHLQLSRTCPNRKTATIATQNTKHHYHSIKRYLSGFSFTGPKNLDGILKTELIKGKSKSEVSEIWTSYHKNKEGILGLIMDGDAGSKVIKRAKKCPFFIQPVFRENGYFMLLSQYQPPSHFFFAYLEDYKMDPNRAQPLITFSIFTDLNKSHDISLLRCDIVNKGIEISEGKVLMENFVDSYHIEKEFSKVKVFNDNPETFEFDEFLSCMNKKWKIPITSSTTVGKNQ